MHDHQIQLWQRAASFAARYHDGQYRKDRKTPYVAHPFRVALIVRQIFEVNDPIAIAASLMHDLIEDTTADYDNINKEFGAEVADIVAVLTKDMRLKNAIREQTYDKHLAEACWQAKLIKLADVYDNICDSTDQSMRDKAKEKAVRAIAIAGDNPRLANAVEQVRSLLQIP